jgi:hypothetical protein
MPFLFDAATHTYTNDGVPVVGVTQLLEIEGLSDWSLVPPDKLEYAKALGSAVHRGSELYELGKLDESTVDEPVKKRLDQWLKFLDFSKEKGWTIGEKWVEPRLYSGLGFAGTPDRIYYNAGFVFIPDIKTGCKTPAAPVQTAAYEILARDFLSGKWPNGFLSGEAKQVKKVLRMAVYLKDDSFEIVEHKNQIDAAIFRSALNLYTYKKREGLL